MVWAEISSLACNSSFNMTNKEIAIAFGQKLDQDLFEETKKLLTEKCTYSIGEETLNGPNAICNSYEQNMLKGRKKMDELVWGESRIEVLSETEFYVHFTDYLTHKGQKYTHKCKQKLSIEHGLIIHIEHIMDNEGEERLNAFYKTVGILD